jgi:hypothetical protein
VVLFEDPKPSDREDSASLQKAGATKLQKKTSGVCSIKRRTRDRARFDARKRRSRSLQYHTSAESRLDSLDSDVRVHAGGPFTLQLPVLFSELRRRRQAGRNMSRLVRALLGLPKPKGSDEREPDDDDPPYPDVTVVVIINKRSGSRLVRGRTASRPFDSHAAFHVGSSFRALFGPPEARDPILTSHVSIRNSNRRACNFRAN